MLVDPEAAAVVKRIFRMTLEGYGMYQIPFTFSVEKVYSPSYYLAQKGFGNYKNKSFVDPYRWYGSTIDYLLGREEYMGHMVNFKTHKTSYKDKHRKKTPSDQRVVFEGVHEAIIDADTWAAANRIREKTRRRKPDSLGTPHPLSGLMLCGDCGSKMYNVRSKFPNGKPKDSYVCADSKRKTVDRCSEHTISSANVKMLVLETLRSVSNYAQENEVEFICKINETFSAQQAGAAKSQRKKLAASQRRRDELDMLIQRLYEDFVAGRLTDKRFEVLSAEYEREQSELEQAIEKLQSDLNSFDDSNERAKAFLELTRRYRDFSELTAPMLFEFVDKIIVYERAERQRRYTTQRVDIHLNFIGAFVPPVSESEQETDPAIAAKQTLRKKRREYQREYTRRRRENGGKLITPEDTRTPEQKAADEAAKLERRKIRHREYQREYQRKLAQMKREVNSIAEVFA